MIKMVNKKDIRNLDNTIVVMNTFSALFIGIFTYVANMYVNNAEHEELNLWIVTLIILASLTLFSIVQYGVKIKGIYDTVE